MAIDSNQLEGLVVENPSAEVRDSARLLKGFLDALLAEQNGKAKKNSRNKWVKRPLRQRLRPTNGSSR